ncbi:hypothetical protein CHS0354_009519 [Potamilus streckersoni]|uniref:Uncharacterized protein n=1 Tax=Potamilus streckersoni TaxID=2493646 RepID=A0AAE0SPJ1_9BIVA|nr:hypothetical protein CHS0354_009519 [Potamilus streckersoni]
MESQHPSQQTIMDIKKVLDEFVKSIIQLEENYVEIVIKTFTELFPSIQLQISEHSHDCETNVKTFIENQYNTPGARCNSSSPNYLLRKANDEDKMVTDEQSKFSLGGLIRRPIGIVCSLFVNKKDGKEQSIAKENYPKGCLSGKIEKTEDQEVLSNESAAPFDVKPIQPLKDEKENITDVQNEPSSLNVIEKSKDICLANLEIFKTSIQLFDKKLKSCKQQLMELFEACEKENKYLINLAPPLKKINEPDHFDVHETSAQGDIEPSISDYSWLLSKRMHTVLTQLYCPKPSDLVTSVTKKLTAMLKKHTITHDIKLKTMMCKSAKDLKKDVPLILICLQSSRLGTDVSNATKGIDIDLRNVAVLILHHADIHALPSQSSKKILTAPEYKNIGTIVDMGFLSPKGLYVCDMNQTSLDDLALFFKRMREKQ